MKNILFFTLLFCSSLAFGASKNILILVHPSSFYDFSFSAKAGINSYLNHALRQGVETQVLVDPAALEQRNLDEEHRQILIREAEAQGMNIYDILTWEKSYLEYLPSIEQAQLVSSYQGENQIQVKRNQRVHLLGGYMHACWREALVDLVMHNLAREKQLHFVFPLEAIYGDVHLDQKGSPQKIYAEFFQKISQEVAQKGLKNSFQFQILGSSQKMVLDLKVSTR